MKNFRVFLEKNFFVFQDRKLKLSASVWNRILWNLTKFQLNQATDRKNGKKMLKVSAFYLEKQKSFVPKKNIQMALCCHNFQWRFWSWASALLVNSFENNEKKNFVSLIIKRGQHWLHFRAWCFQKDMYNTETLTLSIKSFFSLKFWNRRETVIFS